MWLNVVITQKDGLKGQPVACTEREIEVTSLADTTVQRHLENLFFKLIHEFDLDYYNIAEALVEIPAGDLAIYRRKGSGITSAFNWNVDSKTG